MMRTLLLSVFFLFPLFLNAQVMLNSVQEAMDYARNNNRDLAISEKVSSIEKQHISVTRSAFVPQIKAVSSFDYNYALPVQLIPAEFLGGKSGEFRAVQFGTPYNLSAGLEASMPLINASLIAENKIAKYNYEASKEASRHAEQKVMEQVSKGFYYTLLSENSLRISEENFKIADSLKRSAEIKYENGVMEPIDYNRIRNSWLRAKSEVERNRAVLNNNRSSLKFYLGMQQEDSLVLSEEQNALDKIAELKAEVENYPSVREKQLQLTSAYWSLKKERYKRLPEISLYGRYLAQAQRNELNFLDRSYPWYNIGVAGLRLEIPLYTGFARTRNIEKLKFRHEIRQEELNKEIERSKAEDRELKENYQSSLAITKNLEESYRLSGQNVKIALLKYDQGVYSLDQYLNVFNESLNIQAQYLNALAELYSSQTIIELKNNL